MAWLPSSAFAGGSGARQSRLFQLIDQKAHFLLKHSKMLQVSCLQC